MFPRARGLARYYTSQQSKFNAQDPLAIDTLLTPEEREVMETTRRYCQSKLLPRVTAAFRHEQFDRQIMSELGQLGLLGSTVKGYGCAGLSSVGYGLIAKEVEAVDSGYRSALSVQSSLVMFPVAEYGGDVVKERWMRRLAGGEAVGCFGLTEPGAGSDPAGMKTVCSEQPDGSWLVSGSKTWITNSPIADVLVVWAIDKASGRLKGFLVERDQQDHPQQLQTPKIDGKVSLRASCTGMIMLDGARVPRENVLRVDGFRGPFSCLNQARYGIGWGVWGAASACIDLTVAYLGERQQFGRPLAGNQLPQRKLADAVTELGLGMAAAVQVGRLKDAGLVNPEQISLLKRNACGKALDIARQCRDMLGGNGISDEYHVIRHMVNLEAVNTYEGTHDIHALIMGRAITGLSAFS